MLRRAALLALTLWLGVAGGVHAQEWGEIANISATLGVSDSRICIGEASRGDIGCPSFAPTISSTGRINASAGLTVNSVSLTTAGTTWGYLGSAASYIPNLNTNNISLSTINGVSVTNLGGASPTNVPAFRVHRNGVNQTVAASTWTKIAFTNKEFDTYTNFSTATSRFTPTIAGYYIISGGTYCLSSTTCWVMIIKNGANVSQSGSADAGTIVASASAVLYFNGTTDYVELWGHSTGTSLSGESGQTQFSGSLLASGNGLVSGTGASALSGLSDVSLASPASGQVLTYNGTAWVNTTPSATTVISGTTTMVNGWPDAVKCTASNGGTALFYLDWKPSSGDVLYSTPYDSNAYPERIRFTSAGAFSAQDITNSWTVTDCNKSISQLYADGQAFNFIGNSGAGGGALGDRLTSGTLAVTANSSTASVSLSTNGTTWGYLGSAASYLPNLSSNAISTTNISATTINGIAISALGSASPTNVPAFYATMSAAQTGVTANTWTKILYNNEIFDSYNSHNPATGRFTPTIAGNYLFIVSNYCNQNTNCFVALYKNGAMVTYQGNTATSGQDSKPVVSLILNMNGTTDYVEAYGYTAGTSFLNFGANFSGSLLASGNGLISGTGASALSGLSDVSLASPATGQVLTYNGTAWVNTTPSATTVISGTTTMVNGWPDAIQCSGASGTTFFDLYAINTSSLYQYTLRGDAGPTTRPMLQFNSNGTFNALTANGLDGYIESCNSQSISQLYAAGKAFNFIGNSGIGGALGDRLTSGTLSVTANSSSTTVSLTTNGTTWGYLGSSASYVPNMASNSVSSTLVSTTAVQVISTTTPLTCDSGKAGTLRYNSTSSSLELCTGTAWQVMGVGVPAGTISAFASTTCPTGWSEYTAARGRFLRGIDNSAGNDPSGTRVPGDVQADLLRSHSHYISGFGDGSDINGGPTAASGVRPGTYSSTATGGAETRPKNVAVTFCQFNGTSNGWNTPMTSNITATTGTFSGTVTAAAVATGNALYATDRIAFADANYYVLNGSSVGVRLANGATAWAAQSDIRLKNIEAPIENALKKTGLIRNVYYTLKTDKEKTRRVGVIAQDVQKVLPEAVQKEKDGFLSVRYTEIIPLILAALNELHQMVLDILTTLTGLKAENENLKLEMHQMKEQMLQMQKDVQALKAGQLK